VSSALPTPADVLSYDDLPPGSDLRREYHASPGEPGAVVTITVPGGSLPPEAARKESRAAMVRAVAVAAVLALVLGFAAYGVYGDNVRRLDPRLRLAAQALAVAFTFCLFLLLWRIDRDARLDAHAKGRRQSTVLHANHQGLLIETAGPFGQASHRLAGERIRKFSVERLAAEDAGLVSLALPWLVVHLDDGASVRLLPGREAAEIRWVVASIQKALHAGHGGSPKLG
jgi:hypothetical protein